MHIGSSWTSRTHFLEVPKQNHQDLRRDSWQFPTSFELFGPSEILKKKRNSWFYFIKLSVITVHHQQHTRRRKEGKLVSYVLASNSSLERYIISWDFWYYLASDDDDIFVHCVQAAMLTAIKWLPYYCKIFYNFNITFLCCKIKQKKNEKDFQNVHFINQKLYLMIFFPWKF